MINVGIIYILLLPLAYSNYNILTTLAVYKIQLQLLAFNLGGTIDT